MGSALVVATDDSSVEELATLAQTFARGTETEVVVCRFIDEDTYQQEVMEASRSGQQAPDSGEIRTDAEAELRDTVEPLFDVDTDYSVRSVVGPLPDEILEVAEAMSADHVFITAKRRSPAGKVFFRDVAQSVMLNFDGPVTVNFD